MRLQKEAIQTLLTGTYKIPFEDPGEICRGMILVLERNLPFPGAENGIARHLAPYPDSAPMESMRRAFDRIEKVFVKFGGVF